MELGKQEREMKILLEGEPCSPSLAPQQEQAAERQQDFGLDDPQSLQQGAQLLSKRINCSRHLYLLFHAVSPRQRQQSHQKPSNPQAAWTKSWTNLGSAALLMLPIGVTHTAQHKIEHTILAERLLTPTRQAPPLHTLPLRKACCALKLKPNWLALSGG